MGLFDKLKSAVNVVTGGAARVTLQFGGAIHFPGEPIEVRVEVTSTGGEVKSQGVFIDVFASEEVKVKDDQTNQTITKSKGTIQHSVQIAPALVLVPNESKEVVATVVLPPDIPPTYLGTYATHQCYIRGRLEAVGNDPDSGYQTVRIGSRN